MKECRCGRFVALTDDRNKCYWCSRVYDIDGQELNLDSEEYADLNRYEEF